MSKEKVNQATLKATAIFNSEIIKTIKNSNRSDINRGNIHGESYTSLSHNCRKAIQEKESHRNNISGW